MTDVNHKAKAYFDTPAFRFKVDGLITKGIWALSGKKKRNRQLKADFYKINQDRFVNVVYNIQKVKAIIPEDDSVLTKFIKNVPMPYEVARGGEYQQLVWISREWKRYRCVNEDKE